MSYDIEKYREKREKVLGVRRRGLGFGTWVMIVSLIIVVGGGFVVVPKTVSYISTLNLDDAIYKQEGDGIWPHEFVSQFAGLYGVRQAVVDTGGTRLVVTFDRTKTDTPAIATYIRIKGFAAVMLNQINHRQRVATLKEEAEL